MSGIFLEEFHSSVTEEEISLWLTPAKSITNLLLLAEADPGESGGVELSSAFATWDLERGNFDDVSRTCDSWIYRPQLPPTHDRKIDRYTEYNNRICSSKIKTR